MASGHPRSATPLIPLSPSSTNPSKASADLSTLLGGWDEGQVDTDSERQSEPPSPMAVVQVPKRALDTASSTPTAKRSFKRLREALSPRSLNEAVSPSHREAASETSLLRVKPLPASPPPPNTTLPVPTQFTNMQDIITSFDSALFRQTLTLNSLKSLQAPLEIERQQRSELERTVTQLELRARDSQYQTTYLNEQIDSLETALRKEKDEKRKGVQESRGLVIHLEKRLEEEKGFVETLKRTITSLTEEKQGVRAEGDRRVREMGDRLERWQRDAQEKAGESKRRLAEAEFAHMALKEGGARLQRELEKKDRRIEELEKGQKGRI